jgi:hypothetical protein
MVCASCLTSEDTVPVSIKLSELLIGSIELLVKPLHLVLGQLPAAQHATARQGTARQGAPRHGGQERTRIRRW